MLAVFVFCTSNVAVSLVNHRPQRLRRRHPSGWRLDPGSRDRCRGTRSHRGRCRCCALRSRSRRSRWCARTRRHKHEVVRKTTVADASAAMTTAAVAPVTPPAMRTDAASAVAARRPLPGVPTAKRTRTAVETLDEHRLHRLWWFDVVPVTLRVRAQNSAVSLCFPDTEPDNIDGWLSHCHRIIRRWSSSSFYYIGITADPVRRFLEGHSRRGYDIMDVIASVPSSRESAHIERGLLARHREHPHRENTAPAGETPTPGYPHYVYVVARTGPMRSHRSGNSRRQPLGIESDIAFFGFAWHDL